jgi:hypothetical protein
MMVYNFQGDPPTAWVEGGLQTTKGLCEGVWEKGRRLVCVEMIQRQSRALLCSSETVSKNRDQSVLVPPG